MHEMNCAAVRRSLALGDEAVIELHLSQCAGCRHEAALLRRLVEAIAEAAEIAPPSVLDDRVRRVIRGSGTGAARLRPLPAIVMAGFWVVGLTLALMFTLSATPLGAAAPIVALCLVVGFLVLSAAATLPALLPRYFLPSHNMETNR